MYVAMGFWVALIRTAGTPALRRVLPLYIGLFMVAGIVFGPQGMDPSTAVEAMQAAPDARLVLWFGWLLAAAPAARTLWSEASLDYLRWLPVAQRSIWLTLGVLLLVLQIPWVLLWATGGGTLPALGTLWLSAGAHAVIAVRPRSHERWIPITGLLLVAGLLALPLEPTHAALSYAGVGACLWLLALPLAWTRAPERNRVYRSRTWLPGAVPALAHSHLISVVRNHSAVLGRALVLMFIGAGATYLLVRANHLQGAEIGLFSAVVVVVVTTFGCPGLGTAVVESENSLAWLLVNAGLGRNARANARLLTGALLGIALGLALWRTDPLRYHHAGHRGSAHRGQCHGDHNRSSMGCPTTRSLVETRPAVCPATRKQPGRRQSDGRRARPLGSRPAGGFGHVRRGRGIRVRQRRLAAHLGARVILTVEGLSKRLGTRRVIDDLSLACDGGQITILTGDNGAGKSTLLALIAGILQPDRGAIAIAGADHRRQPRAARRALGYVPEAANPPGHLTGDELFGLVCQLKQAPPLAVDIRAALAIERIADARIERLSLGERRRVCLGAALIGEPALLVLDEPTNGLDKDGIATLIELLRDRRTAGAAVLIATHDRAFADQLADVHMHLRDGQLIAGSIPTNLNSP